MLPEILTQIPGPRSLELGARLRRCESRNITCLAADFPVFWERAAGVNVWDADGNRFLDLTSAFGVAGLGHTNPQLREALTAQAQQLFHGMGDVHPSEPKVALCEKLSALTFERWNAGTGKTILGNSGFEAIEAALKTALLKTGKPGVIAFNGAYHGLGYGALEVGGLPFFQNPFRRQLREFATLLPYPHCESSAQNATNTDDFPEDDGDCLSNLRKKIEIAISEKIASEQEIGAILAEPIQGRGGIVVPPRDFLKMLREVCDAHGLLLIVDEIFTGFNRTGALFACEHSGVVPDIICLGKALTGGLPVSACVGRAEIMDAWPESQGEALHTSTFLGNPLGCAMALAALEQHANSDLAARVQKAGADWKSSLTAIHSPRIKNVRGAGLMIGVEIVNEKGEPDGATALQIMKQALRDGIILLADSPQGNVLALTPPFEITVSETDFFTAKLQEYLTSLPGSVS